MTCNICGTWRLVENMINLKTRYSFLASRLMKINVGFGNDPSTKEGVVVDSLGEHLQAVVGSKTNVTSHGCVQHAPSAKPWLTRDESGIPNYPPPEIQHSAKDRQFQKETIVFQASIFRGELLACR